MVAHFARRVFLATIAVCCVYNTILVSFIPSRSFTASGTGAKRLFYSFRPPGQPHQVVSLPKDRVAIFVGDIHGCLDELKKLLAEVATLLQPHKEFVLFFLGDMVNKGPHSSKTVKFIRRLVGSGRAHVVRGNHDEALLEAIHSATLLGRLVRFMWPYGKYHYIKYLTDEDVAFIESLPYTITIPEINTILVHAGLVPNVPLVEQEPDYMVRMRSIGEHGPTHILEDGEKWAQVYQQSNQTTRIIFGHDSRRRLQQDEKYLGLDTGAVYGDKLTAMVRFPNGTEQLVSVQSEPYEAVKGQLLHS